MTRMNSEDGAACFTSGASPLDRIRPVMLQSKIDGLEKVWLLNLPHERKVFGGKAIFK